MKFLYTVIVIYSAYAGIRRHTTDVVRKHSADTVLMSVRARTIRLHSPVIILTVSLYHMLRTKFTRCFHRIHVLRWQLTATTTVLCCALSVLPQQ